MVPMVVSRNLAIVNRLVVLKMAKAEDVVAEVVVVMVTKEDVEVVVVMAIKEVGVVSVIEEDEVVADVVEAAVDLVTGEDVEVLATRVAEEVLVIGVAEEVDVAVTADPINPSTNLLTTLRRRIKRSHLTTKAALIS